MPFFIFFAQWWEFHVLEIEEIFSAVGSYDFFQITPHYVFEESLMYLFYSKIGKKPFVVDEMIVWLMNYK